MSSVGLLLMTLRVVLNYSGHKENAMTDVLDIVKQARRIPLSELILRSSESPQNVTEAVRWLQEKGLVTVRGGLPDNPEQLQEADTTVVEFMVPR
jgi:hypothetical protein